MTWHPTTSFSLDGTVSGRGVDWEPHANADGMNRFLISTQGPSRATGIMNEILSNNPSPLITGLSSPGDVSDNIFHSHGIAECVTGAQSYWGDIDEVSKHLDKNARIDGKHRVVVCKQLLIGFALRNRTGNSAEVEAHMQQARS